MQKLRWLSSSGRWHRVALIRTDVSEDRIASSETSVLITATRCHLPEDDNHHSHRRGNLKSYYVKTVSCASKSSDFSNERIGTSASVKYNNISLNSNTEHYLTTLFQIRGYIGYNEMWKMLTSVKKDFRQADMTYFTVNIPLLACTGLISNPVKIQNGQIRNVAATPTCSVWLGFPRVVSCCCSL
jgi:hypothetical protein